MQTSSDLNSTRRDLRLEPLCRSLGLISLYENKNSPPTPHSRRSVNHLKSQHPDVERVKGDVGGGGDAVTAVRVVRFRLAR